MWITFFRRFLAKNMNKLGWFSCWNSNPQEGKLFSDGFYKYNEQITYKVCNSTIIKVTNRPFIEPLTKIITPREENEYKLAAKSIQESIEQKHKDEGQKEEGLKR